MKNVWLVAAVWMGLAFIASVISIRTRISVALIEILVGVVAGNVLIGWEGGRLVLGLVGSSTGGEHLHHILTSTEWTNFLALLGSGVLTFLAGAEIDPVSLRANFRSSLVVGILSFLLPFVFVWLFAQFALGWKMREAQIAGIALSTTSVAVVYAVMIEGNLGETPMGKMILASCFITDLGTVLALGTLFASFTMWLVAFIVVTGVVLWFMPRWTRFLIHRLGATRVSEPEIKFLLLVLFFLGGLASAAGSEAVLPAYLLGLVVAGVFLRDKTLVHRMRTIAFAMFTPFYFIKAGLHVSLPALATSLGAIALLLAAKLLTKSVGVWPSAWLFGMRPREASYTTLLMSTGLTFGSISALFGLQHNIINQTQYSILLTVVILSAFVPTLLAQAFFQPTYEIMQAWRERFGIRRRASTPPAA